MSFKLGKIHIVFALVGLVAAILWRKKVHEMRGVFIAITVMTALSVFLLLSASSFVWQTVPFFSYIQYPWRFLGIAMFGLSFFLSVPVGIVQKPMFRYLACAALIAILLIGNANLFRPKYLYVKEPAAFETDEELRFRVSKISDEYLPPDVTRPQSKDQIPKTTIDEFIGGGVELNIDTETQTMARLTPTRSEVIRFNRAHFPGWHYFLDGKEVQPVLDGGRPTFFVTDAAHVFEAHFSDTPVRIIGNIVSALAAVIFVVFLSRYEKKDVR